MLFDAPLFAWDFAPQWKLDGDRAATSAGKKNQPVTLWENGGDADYVRRCNTEIAR
jgi:hypothetical protein